jgi:hypothetical protein
MADESELDKTYLSDPRVDLTAHVGDPARSPGEVADIDRAPERGEPPVPGAQWDEAHRRWEVWDEASGEWKIVGDDAGDGVAPGDENPLPWLLAREVTHGDELASAHEAVADVHRASPEGPAPRGAQWNEVAGRWERWDEATEAWVEATADAEDPEPT